MIELYAIKVDKIIGSWPRGECPWRIGALMRINGDGEGGPRRSLDQAEWPARATIFGSREDAQDVIDRLHPRNEVVVYKIVRLVET